MDVFIKSIIVPLLFVSLGWYIGNHMARIFSEAYLIITFPLLTRLYLFNYQIIKQYAH